MANPTVAAILGYTSDPQLQAAMALGAQLEGGWNLPFPVGDSGTSFGPYQIHLPAHPGVSAAEASDPVWATGYMGPSYSSGVRSVGDASDPEAAAEQAAFHAERPAEDYVSSRGQNTVDAAWARTLLAIPSTSAAALITGSSGSGGINWPAGFTPPYPTPSNAAQQQADFKALTTWEANKGGGGSFLPNPLSDAKNAVTDAVSGAFGAVWDDAKPFLVTFGFVGLGLSLVLAGLVISTRGARSSATTTLPGAAGGAAAAAGGGAGLADLAPLALA